VSRAPRRRSCKARDRAVLREYREGAERGRCGCIDVRMQAYLWNGALRIVLWVAAIAAALVLLPPLALFLVFVVLVPPLLKANRKRADPPCEGGGVEVSPSRVTAGGDPVPVRISYRVGPEGIREGGAIQLCPGKVLRFSRERWRLCLQWSNGWGRLQRRHPGRENYLDVSTPADGVVLRVSLLERAVDRALLRWLKRKFLQKMRLPLKPIDPEEAFLECQKVTVSVAEGELVPGDVVNFELGSGAGLVVPHSAISTDFAIEVDPLGREEFRLEAVVPSLTATGGEPASLEVVAPSIAAPGETIKVLVRCLDKRGVLTGGFTGRLLLSSPGEIQVPGSVIVAGSDGGVAWFQAAVIGPGVSYIRAVDEERGLEGESNPIVCAGRTDRLLWGDLHTHSLVSDGTQEPWFYYHRARDLLGWDFTSVVDHDIWSLGEEHARTPEEFELMMRLNDENHLPGEFVTFPGFEWTQHHLGHRHILFGPGEEPVLLPHTDPLYATPGLLLEALAGRKALVIPHHTAWKTHFGEMYFDFGPRESPFQRLVEVYSQHGNSEFYGCPRPIDHVALMEGLKGKIARAVMGTEYAGPQSGSYVRDALAAGYRLGLIAGSDEHLDAGDPRKAPGRLYGGGITGVFAGAVTREALWEALWKRRVCGTTGARIFMEFHTDGHPHGSEIEADGPLRITGHVIGTSDLELVELVKFDSGGYSTPWQQGGDGREAVVDFIDRRFRENSFYYLRVVQSDGHMGWAGPTWVDKTP
ncbi:MAG: DUF3604 domain-containing protein, partial [Actinomycetia bacterium]|nr:DUF3604 domain-containing protein [Actinomycetes bacterium]